MHFKSVQIFFDLKKTDRCKKWWIRSRNPKILNFCVFSVFFCVFLWYPVICLAWLAMLFAFRCQVSINQWAPVTHHLSFCSSGLAMSLSAACRRLANVLFCLHCFLDPFHWFILPIWNPTLNKVICANIPIFFIFQNRSYKAPVHGSNSLAGCFQCFSFFPLFMFHEFKTHGFLLLIYCFACFHFFHVCSFFFILLHYFSFRCMFFHFVAFISFYFIFFHFISFFLFFCFGTKTQLV